MANRFLVVNDSTRRLYPVMAEELVKNNRSIFGKVVTGVEHAAVGLPFVHLLQPPPGNPDENGLNQKRLRTSSTAMCSAEWR